MERRDWPEPAMRMDAILSALLKQLTGDAGPNSEPSSALASRVTAPIQERKPAPPATDRQRIAQPTGSIEPPNLVSPPAPNARATIEVPPPQVVQQAGRTRFQQIQPNPLAPLRVPGAVETIDPGLRPRIAMQALHAELLRFLEMGQIRPDEMARFRKESSDDIVDRELMGMQVHVRELEMHRLRLIAHLRALLSSP